MTIRSGRPSVSPSEAKNFKILIAITPVMYEAVEQFGLDSGLSKYGRSAVLRELLEIALTAKGYLTPSTRPPASASTTTATPPHAAPQPSKPTAFDAKLAELAQRYERNGHSLERREAMLQKDREWMEKNGIPA